MKHVWAAGAAMLLLAVLAACDKKTGPGEHTPGSPLPAAWFQDVTVSSGLARCPGKAMGIVCADFNGDHWQDIFVTDDGLPNRLFINQRNGTFAEQAVQRGLAYTALGGRDAYGAEVRVHAGQRRWLR